MRPSRVRRRRALTCTLLRRSALAAPGPWTPATATETVLLLLLPNSRWLARWPRPAARQRDVVRQLPDHFEPRGPSPPRRRTDISTRPRFAAGECSDPDPPARERWSRVGTRLPLALAAGLRSRCAPVGPGTSRNRRHPIHSVPRRRRCCGWWCRARGRSAVPPTSLRLPSDRATLWPGRLPLCTGADQFARARRLR